MRETRAQKLKKCADYFIKEIQGSPNWVTHDNTHFWSTNHRYSSHRRDEAIRILNKYIREEAIAPEEIMRKVWNIK